MDLVEIGNLLKQARIDNKLKIKNAAKDLKIRVAYIEAMESGDLSAISSQIYPIGYLKSYAKWLGLDSDKLASYLREYKEELRDGKPLSTETSSFSYSGLLAQRPGIFAFTSAIVLTLSIYGIWYFQRPTLSIPSKEVFEKAPTQTETTEVSPAGVSAPPVWFDASTPHLLLMAREDGWIRLYRAPDAIPEEYPLKAGDVHFLRDISRLGISAQKPGAVEVFLDGENSTFLGTLQELKETHASPLPEVLP